MVAAMHLRSLLLCTMVLHLPRTCHALTDQQVLNNISNNVQQVLSKIEASDTRSQLLKSQMDNIIYRLDEIEEEQQSQRFLMMEMKEEMSGIKVEQESMKMDLQQEIQDMKGELSRQVEDGLKAIKLDTEARCKRTDAIAPHTMTRVASDMGHIMEDVKLLISSMHEVKHGCEAVKPGVEQMLETKVVQVVRKLEHATNVLIDGQDNITTHIQSSMGYLAELVKETSPQDTDTTIVVGSTTVEPATETTEVSAAGCQEGQTSDFSQGDRVVRGEDWSWGDQDGSPPGKGTILGPASSSGWIRVRWDNKHENNYRVGNDDKYDLMCAPEDTIESRVEAIRKSKG